MFKFIKKNTRKRQLKKVKEGDGHFLKPYRLWHNLTKSLFHLEFETTSDEHTHYAIEHKYFVSEPQADLYRNKEHIAYSKLPATFQIEEGFIEVASGQYGIKRIHYVTNNGKETPLYPDPRSIRGMRLGMDKHFPLTSRLLGFFPLYYC